MQSTNLLYTLDQSPGEGAPCMHAMDLVPGGVVRDALQHPACPPEDPLSTFRGNVNSGWHSPVLLVLICSLRSWRAPMVPQLSLSCPLLLVVLKLFSWLTALRRNCSKYRCTFDICLRERISNISWERVNSASTYAAILGHPGSCVLIHSQLLMGMFRLFTFNVMTAML